MVDVTGLNAEATSSLRRKCFKSEINMVVVKNNLLHKAFEAPDVDFEPLYGSLKGNTAVLFSQTANVPAKLLKEYRRKVFLLLRQLTQRNLCLLVLINSKNLQLSRARTNLLQTLWHCYSLQQRTLFLLSSQVLAPSMVCLRL